MPAPPLIPTVTPAQMAASEAAFNEFVHEAFTLLAIAWIAIALRTWGRWSGVGIRNFELDDYVMVFAGILYSLETGLAYIVGDWYHGFANNGLTTAQRHALVTIPNPETQMIIDGSKVQLIGWSIYTLLLWSVKLCLCVFYRRLTSGVDHMLTRVRIGYALIGITYLSTILPILLSCQPFYKNWQIYPDPGVICQPAISPVNCIVTVVLNVLTDIYLLSIPLPMLWKTRITITQKFLLLGLFSGGFFVIACGILRCVLILTDPVTGAQQAGSWAVRETFISVFMSNLPIIYHKVNPIIKRWFRQAKTATHYGTKSKMSTLNEHPSELSTMDSAALQKKRNKFAHPLSLRNATFSGSDEHLSEMEDLHIGIKREIQVDIEETTDNIDHSPKDSDDDINRTGYTGYFMPGSNMEPIGTRGYVSDDNTRY